MTPLPMRQVFVFSLALGLAVLPLQAHADKGGGLDLTMQVLGKDERVDDRLVNRIQVPGIGGALSREAAAERATAREQRQAAREERRAERIENRERRRDRGD